MMERYCSWSTMQKYDPVSPCTINSSRMDSSNIWQECVVIPHLCFVLRGLRVIGFVILAAALDAAFEEPPPLQEILGFLVENGEYRNYEATDGPADDRFLHGFTNVSFCALWIAAPGCHG